ncbi:right-handed parallel beta-helix repeat-containing protein, partial [Bartonella capreoli]|uniref:right-handed parallel beta-helix repeat-containing protein n=1 Tax=Bartonella capreoli TaxID=155192 RepID=UPI001ABCF88F
MVMRRVLNHHVCFCVLSTAILAGLALMTSQNKVYAQAQNCKGVDSGGENQPIVCDGTTNGSGWSVDGRPANSGEWGGLSVNRTINMNKYSGKAAVTVYNGSGGRAKIMIKDKLTVTDSKGTSNNTTAIKVERGGELALVGGVDVTGVKKGIVVEGRGSSVMVLQGTIGVRAKGGGSLIEVSNNGKVVLMKGVKVGTVSENVNGEVVINNGGTVELMGTGLSVSKGTGIKIMGTGTATVRGGGATITLQGGGTGMDVEGTASADVMDMTITGSGNTGTGVLINGSGTVTLTKVQLMQLETGARVTSGVLTLNGGSKIEVGQNGKGVWVTNGKVVMMGGSLTVKGNGKGMEVEGGIVTMMGTTVTGDGSGKGLVINGRTANVTLERVNISGFAKGVEVSKGTLKLEGTTKIEVGGNGSGVSVSGSGQVMMNGTTTITVKGSGKGVYVTGGEVTMMEGTTKIEVTENGTGMSVSGGDVVMSGETTITVKGSGDGLNVSGGTVMMMGKTTITGSGSGKGVYVTGGRGNVTLENVNISEVATGVYMTGGTLMVREGMIVGNGSGTGIYAKSGNLTVEGVDISKVERGVQMDGGTLTVEGGEIGFAGSGKGVYVGSSVTRATLTNVTIVGRGKGDGIYVKGGTANVTLEGVNISNVERGIWMEGKSLTVKGGKIGFKGTYGVMVGSSVKKATLTNVEIVGRGDNGVGVWVEGGSLTVSRGSIKGVKAGIYVVGVWVKGGEVMMERVDISNVETGVVMSDGAMWLKETHLRNVAKGMTIEEGVVRMEGGSVTFKGDHAISLTKGNAILKDVSMTYKGDNRVTQDADVVSPSFIKVEKGTVAAEKLTITGNGKNNIQGVKVTNGGAVWLKETNFTNVRSGMTVKRGGIIRMEGGSITFTGGHGISVSGGQAVLSGFSITGQGDTSKATATGTGVGVSNLGKVMMRDVNISQVEMGARVTSGLLVMDKGGITFKGKHGVNLISGYALLNGVNIKGPGSGTGIELGYGQVLMKGTTFTNVDKAMTVTQGDVKMEGGEIEFKGEHGILLGQGGVALMGVTMTYKGNSPTADFIKITGEDTTNAVEAVDPKTKNTFTPKSAVVVAASLKIDGNGHGQALNVTNGGRVVLVNPTYTNVHTGMTITKGAVQMLGGEITFKGEHGILLKRGHALLTNVTMTYKGYEQNTTFLKVEAENVLNTADIIGTGIKIDGKGYGQGVHVTKGGRVKLKNAVFSDVVKGVSVANGEFWMKGGEIAFKGDYGVSLSTGKVVLKGVIMEYKG